MKLSFFESTLKKYSLVVFIQENDVEKYKADLEKIGQSSKIKLVVQPCPFEGVEFLYRTPLDMPGQMVSLEKDLFWHALPLNPELSESEFARFSTHHHELLVAILEQDVSLVNKHRKAIESFLSS